MDGDFAAYLRVGAVTFDGADATLLRAIDETGSLNAAAETLGRSYSRAHKRLTTLEEELGSLVERERGGSGGGGSALTEDGRDVLGRFARLQAVLEGTATTAQIVLRGQVCQREGELVTVDTAAGRIQAVATGLDGRGGQDVEVTLTADSVTLHDPGGKPQDDVTSARNRLQGVVSGVDERNEIATVTVDVGAQTPLSVLVTAASRKRLELTDGSPVTATFKATAARATSVGNG